MAGTSGCFRCCCCGDDFMGHSDEPYCDDCIEAQCKSYHENGMAHETECQKPLCGCGEPQSRDSNGEWSCPNDCSRFHVGAEVYWNDPDKGTASGYYTITEIVPAGSETIFKMINEQGSYVEAFIHECN